MAPKYRFIPLSYVIICSISWGIIACLLVFNNLMVVGITKIPWFSYSPFHAAMEIITSRMIINLYKAANDAGSKASKTYVSSLNINAPSKVTASIPLMRVSGATQSVDSDLLVDYS
ncbi:hypothetical protein M422DRAFT_274974 [Sphaerobolus stellatus SS14]|uniref:Uncharacterized protein n=1 Tax=Sphaerobolus stellatus (strain SS14) TaxID=990650 RepID=A0A0C9UFN6_SPHS4|nr:hypothetical protein M422DRAFT_274974 [Sphaerobolus stellatus SS14]